MFIVSWLLDYFVIQERVAEQKFLCIHFAAKVKNFKYGEILHPFRFVL